MQSMRYLPKRFLYINKTENRGRELIKKIMKNVLSNRRYVAPQETGADSVTHIQKKL